MESEQKKRITWIDMAKGYGIILVILGHLKFDMFRDWIFTFHMPLFFFLSGYVFSTKYDFVTFLKRKCRSMILPYLCLGMPMVVFKIIYEKMLSIKEVEELLKKFIIQDRMWPIWFLTCLFCMNLLFYAAVKLLKTDQKMAVFSIATVVAGWYYYKKGGPDLPWNMDICLMVFPFFFAGYFYKEHHEKLDAFLAGKKKLGICFVIMESVQLVSGYIILQTSGHVLDLFHDCYGVLPLTYVAAFAGIMSTICVAKWTTIRPIRYIGEQSLLYFAWHQTMVLPLITDLLDAFHIRIRTSSGMMAGVSYRILECVLILLFITGCNMAISRSKWKVILGK